MNIKYVAKELERILTAPGSEELIEVVAVVDGKYGDRLGLGTKGGPMEEDKLYIMVEILGKSQIMVKEKELLILQVDNGISFPSSTVPD